MSPTLEKTGPGGKRHSPSGRRRGVVAVVVLLLIAVALATSYSALRTQTITLNVRQNALLGVSARQAALTGLAAGFRELHSPNWTGTGTTFAMALGPHEGFRVRFIAGDGTLAPGHPDFDELPYRVTLLVIGTASDPADPNRTSRHTIRAVARLIPRAMPAEPSDWAAMQRHMFYQTQQHSVILDPPCRIEGSVRLQGALRLGHHYPNDFNAWGYYFHHLNQMRWAGYPDHRTLSGPVYFDYSQQDWVVRDMLNNYMAVATSDRDPDTANSDWVKPTSLTSYRLYPGGPEYQIPALFGTVDNRTLAESVTDNPLGFYYAGANLTLGDNVTVRGTLFCRDNIYVEGADVRFESVDLPPILGSSLPIRLPVATCHDFDVRAGASCIVDGLLVAFDDVDVERASARGKLLVRGRLIAGDLDVCEDDDWNNLDWNKELADWKSGDSEDGDSEDGDLEDGSWVHFPVWMSGKGYHHAPTVQIKPGEEVQYHWHRPGRTVFRPHPDDYSPMDAFHTPGLRWEMIDVEHQPGGAN